MLSKHKILFLLLLFDFISDFYSEYSFDVRIHCSDCFYIYTYALADALIQSDLQEED